MTNVRATRAELLQVSEFYLLLLDYIQIQEFVSTLTEEQCKTVIINLFSTKGGVDLVKSALLSDPPNQPTQQPNNLPCCLCVLCQLK